MTEVVYARIPQALKEALDHYAGERALTLTGAVVDLVGRGLAAVSDEMSVHELQARLLKLAAELEQAKAELGPLRALNDRTQRPLGNCPDTTCRAPVTGYDLLARGQCSKCGAALPDLLALGTSGESPAVEPVPNFSERDVLLLLGAVGAVVGVAYLASRGGA